MHHYRKFHITLSPTPYHEYKLHRFRPSSTMKFAAILFLTFTTLALTAPALIQPEGMELAMVKRDPEPEPAPKPACSRFQCW